MNKIFNTRNLVSVLNRISVLKMNKKMLKESINEASVYNDVELTKDEISLIKSRWDVLGWRYDLSSFKVFKALCGFNPDFIPEELYYPVVHSKLNPYIYRYAFSNKGNYSTLFPEIRQPEILLKMVDGVFYGKDCETMDLGAANHVFKNSGSCFIKPSEDSMTGFGCRMIDDSSRMDLEEILSDYPNGFVLQKAIKQSVKTAVFNDESLNCFRVTSVNINGRITAPTVCLKFGRNGLRVDNVGRGGCIIGVNPEDGTLDCKAYCSDLSTIDGINGLLFRDMTINGLNDIVEFAIKYHRKYFINLGIVGWDIALDDHDSPVMVEANLHYPGVHLEQIASRKPIFGDRTEEVIKWCISKPIRHIY